MMRKCVFLNKKNISSIPRVDNASIQWSDSLRLSSNGPAAAGAPGPAAAVRMRLNTAAARSRAGVSNACGSVVSDVRG